MNKYFIRIGEELLDRWGGDYIAFSTKSEQELLDTYRETKKKKYLHEYIFRILLYTV